MRRSNAAGTRRASAPRSVLSELGELVLPQRCIACERFGAAPHDRCAETLPRAQGRRCDACWTRLGHAGRYPRCSESASALDGRRAALLYDRITRRAILESNFGGVSALLSPLGPLAASTVPAAWSVDVIVPIPLHPSRARRRGFNQAEFIARGRRGARSAGAGADAAADAGHGGVGAARRWWPRLERRGRVRSDARRHDGGVSRAARR